MRRARSIKRRCPYGWSPQPDSSYKEGLQPRHQLKDVCTPAVPGTAPPPAPCGRCCRTLGRPCHTPVPKHVGDASHAVAAALRQQALRMKVKQAAAVVTTCETMLERRLSATGTTVHCHTPAAGPDICCSPSTRGGKAFAPLPARWPRIPPRAWPGRCCANGCPPGSPRRGLASGIGN